MTDFRALALALLSIRLRPAEVLPTLELAKAMCNVLDPLSDDEIKRTATPVLAEKIIAEWNRIIKRAVD
jgi:hypothetical protein